MNQITKKEINVDIIENNNKKKSKLKIVLLIIAILVVVMAVVAAILIQTKPLLKYRVKKLFGIGVGKTVTTVVKIDNDDVEKILVGEFTRRENVDFNQSLMLINTNYTLSEDFVADIEEYKTSTVMMNKSMTADYAKLSQSVIDKFDQKLFVMSSVRTAEEQQELYDELGAETAVPPGASEHQSALALDVYVTGYAGAGFLQSEVGVYV
ncbi:MAG: M15 family metallopeptidase, partial [Clostridiales bacterium]|nr:M15 family metallopeptidase [Clostridiales bacterium]